MSHPIEPSTFSIFSRHTGSIVGTGFLVATNLGLTCAHVIDAAFPDAEYILQIRFTGRREYIEARALLDRVNREKDVAILEIDTLPEGVHPLRMGQAGESRLDNKLYTYGYAMAANEQGLGGLGAFITYISGTGLIQFRMHEADHGHSGAPVFDDKRGMVIGMVKKGKDQPGRNDETTFAISTETIWQVYPELKPPTPILPRRNPIVEGINLLPYDYNQRIQSFLTEYLGTAAHPIPFGGRDDALKMLNNWLAGTTPYLLLAAPAGRGKSALLVRWLDNLSARDDLSLAFVPVSIRFGTNMESVFYAALAARLAFLHGDDIPANLETSTAVYRGLVRNYLSKPLADGRTLLVVLDGLDEAADWQAGADFMPGELPAGVRVAVSARFLAGDADSTSWLRRLNWARGGMASTPSLFPLDQTGVAEVLLKMSCPLNELSRNVDIVEELYRLSEGDPLLVGLYVGDLGAKGEEEVTRLQPKDLTGIQPGYKGYFDHWWDDQKKLWGKEKPWLEQHVRAMRKILAGALGPLFKTDFQTLDLELESDYIDDALDVLQRFIIGDNQKQGYTFSHPKLGQYFWEALTPTEQTQLEERFLAWGEQTLQELIAEKRDSRKKAEVPGYVVRNYGAHMARAKQPIEKWLPLIYHQQWAQACFTMEGAYGGYIQDIHRVWAQCRLLDEQAIEAEHKAPSLGQQIRCALIEASLHSLSARISPELLTKLMSKQLCTLPQALAYIRQMPNTHDQARSIIALMSLLSDEECTTLLKVARQIGHKRDRLFALSMLASRQPGAAREALEIMPTVKNKKNYAMGLVILAESLPQIYLDDVLRMARDERDESLYAKAIEASKKERKTIIQDPEYQTSSDKNALETSPRIEDKANYSRFLKTLVNQTDEVGNATKKMEKKHKTETRQVSSHSINAVASYLQDKMGLRNAGGLVEQSWEEENLKETPFALDIYDASELLSTFVEGLSEKEADELLALFQNTSGIIQAYLISRLALYWPKYLEKAFTEISEIFIDEKIRVQLLESLVIPLIEVPATDSYVWFSQSLQALASRNRQILILDLETLLPVLFHIGPETLNHEIYSAIRDVTTWWP